MESSMNRLWFRKILKISLLKAMSKKKQKKTSQCNVVVFKHNKHCQIHKIALCSWSTPCTRQPCTDWTRFHKNLQRNTLFSCPLFSHAAVAFKLQTCKVWNSYKVSERISVSRFIPLRASWMATWTAGPTCREKNVWVKSQQKKTKKQWPYKNEMIIKYQSLPVSF